MLKQIKRKGEYFKNSLNSLARKFSFINEVRGSGLLIGLALDEKVSGKSIVLEALKKGFILNCAGHNTLRFAPPITTEEIDALIAALDSIFTDIK